jgi:hypothetical protein
VALYSLTEGVIKNKKRTVLYNLFLNYEITLEYETEVHKKQNNRDVQLVFVQVMYKNCK